MTGEELDSASRAESSRPLELLGDASFLHLWVIGATTSTVRWLEMLSVGVYVFDLTGSAFQVALLMMLRMFPLAALGVFSGVIGERLNRRVILLAGNASMLVVSAALAYLALAGRVEIWHLALGAVLNGVFWTTDFAARRPIVADVVGLGRIGAAMALDSVTNNGTRMLGPLLGGLLLQQIGLGGTFCLSAALYLLGLAMVLSFRYQDERVKAEPAMESLVAGIRHLRTNKTLVGVLTITIVFNLWGYPFTSMIPVVGRDLLELSPFFTGLLASAEGAGAVLGAIVIAVFGTHASYGRLYVYGTGVYLATILAFALSDIAPLSGCVLICTGMAGAAFATMQSTLVLLHSPVEVRSRMMGVLSMCIGTGPIGFLIIGATANALGAPQAMLISATAGLLCLVVAARVWPELTRPPP